MGFLKKLFGLVRACSDHLIAALMASMFVVFILQVIFRYLLDLPVGWTVEWVTIAWLWGLLFSFAFSIKNSELIRLDIFYTAVPQGARRSFDVITGLTCAVIFALTLPAAWDYITFMNIEKSAYMRIPMGWLFGIYIPFHIAVIVRMLHIVWQAITGR